MGMIKKMEHQEGLLSLHRYFIWSDRMRVHFEDILKRKDQLNENIFRIETNLYMSYWYGGLYVVIEGYKELGLSDAKIDNLLNSPNVDLLKRYRNGVFHFQKKYNDDRFMRFITDGENCVEWVHSLREEFSRYFLDIFRNKNT